jgi:hypothetical protein
MVSNSEQPIMASSVIRGSAAALVIKFTAAILGFVMFALASREMGLEAFGSPCPSWRSWRCGVRRR